DGAGRRNRAVVSEAGPGLRELVHQLRRDLRDALHVTAVLRVQQPAGDLRAGLPAIAGHLRPLAQHLLGDRELLVHDRCRTLLARDLERCLPARHRHLARNFLGELHRFRRAVLQSKQSQGAAESEEPHAMTALAQDLLALLLERESIDLDHVVEHAGEHLHHLAVFVPVEFGEVGERMLHEAGEVHGTEEAVMYDNAVDDQRMRREFLDVVNPLHAHRANGIDTYSATLAWIMPTLFLGELSFELRLLRRVERESDVAVVPITVPMPKRQSVERVALRYRRMDRPVDTKIQQQQLDVLQPGTGCGHEADGQLVRINAAIRTECRRKKRGLLLDRCAEHSLWHAQLLGTEIPQAKVLAQLAHSFLAVTGKAVDIALLP